MDIPVSKTCQPVDDFGRDDARADGAVELFCRRARVGLWCTALSLATFVGADLAVRPEGFQGHVAVKLLQMALLLAAAAALRHPRHRRHARAILLGCLVVVDVCMVLVGIDRHDAETASSLLIATTLSAGFMLPWSPWWQAAVAVVASAASWTLTLAVDGVTTTAVYPTIGRTLLFLGSIFVVRLADARRRERADLEAALRVGERSLREANARLAEEGRVAAALLHVTATLQKHVRSPDMLERVNRLAVAALGCDWSSTFIQDDDRGGLVLRSTVGARPEVATELGLLVFSPPRSQDDVFSSDDYLNRTGVALEAGPASLMRRFDVAAYLCTPVRHDGTVRALLVHGCRERHGGFTPSQRRLAVGIARATAIALENARLIADLERASTLKSEFVATMSHELRTPLNIIVGYGDMLLEGGLGSLAEPALDAVRRIRQRTVELLDLVNATLDLNRLDAGRTPLDRGPVDLAALLAEVTRELAPMAPDGVALRATCDPPGATVSSDCGKLKTIMRNLVGNALKFTPAGTVTVDCAVDDGGLAIVVRDTGIGIAPEHLPVIFDMFRQVDGSATRRFGGVGLGLHIVKRLVDLLGGTIDVESTPGVGATFVVRVPDGEHPALRATGT
jgi:signal transduction histidine kinase